MAVPQEPINSDAEENSRQVTSQKVVRTKAQKNNSSPIPVEEYLRISLSAFDKNRRDPVFKLRITTNVANYKKSTYPLVERTYNEFERLYSALTCGNPECIVPALPIATSSFQATEEDERRIKNAMQQWINRITNNPFLRHDEELKSFIETDFAARKDEDEELASARAISNTLESHLLENARAVQKLAKIRKGLAICTADLGAKAIGMGTVEKHPPLSSGLRKLGKTLQIVSELQQLQAMSEAAALGDFFNYYAVNAHIVRETLTNRLRIIADFESAVKTTESKRRYIERLKSSTQIKSDRVDEALDDLDYAQNYEATLGARVNHVTKNLHNELTIYEENRTQDFLGAFKEYVKKQIFFEKQQLKEWENLRPDINAITKRNMRVHTICDEELDARAIAERLSTYM
ncbi:1224_t:CDS:2 [Ambispora gerdemannii]|uniref:1224_t:CDS:1 n=1 Tax=Ambispora gerdemannii TaxID=144530 RepID=A0A9N9G158_9GLOM|nr:1224_t:CDS:2 [Ambispora gerdemannii]